MRSARDGFDITVQVAVEDEARLALHRPLGASARKRAELHVVLVQLLVLLGLLKCEPATSSKATTSTG